MEIPTGCFRMGSADFYPEEEPVRDVEVSRFAVDRGPVTVAQFARFVGETGYLTLAERTPDPANYPDADPSLLREGARPSGSTRHAADSKARSSLGAMRSNRAGADGELLAGRLPLAQQRREGDGAAHRQSASFPPTASGSTTPQGTSGSGRPTTTRSTIQAWGRLLPALAASRRSTRISRPRTEALISGVPARAFPAVSSRAAPICARRATAFATDPPLASPRRSTPPPATSDFAASSVKTADLRLSAGCAVIASPQPPHR